MISLNNLSFSYPKSERKILNKLDVVFEKGILNVIVGLNGAGKTTLFDILIGQYKPSEGGIVNVPEMKDILYHVQGAYISFLVTGKDYVRLIYASSNLNYYSDSNAMVENMDFENDRDRVKFINLWGKRIGQMSIGERRWLYIVTLSQIKKKMYIFDEPTAGVDPSARIGIYKRLEKLTLDKSSTVILATHHLHELQELNCKIILLHEGCIKFQGNYKQFLLNHNTDNPDHAFDSYINC